MTYPRSDRKSVVQGEIGTPGRHGHTAAWAAPLDAETQPAPDTAAASGGWRPDE